ncbi:MAG: apolipoprotein N-acyltransferase [Burkholderiaceae bacterium]|nr:apolipoprotein N-acyltransferase [Burkholderiaceae bacterium]
MRAITVALALGLAHALAFNVGAWGPWLQLLCLAGLTMLTLGAARDAARPSRVAALVAFAFGLSSFGAGIGWLFISMNRYGGLPAPLAALAVLLLAGYLAAFGAAAFGLATKLGAIATSRLDRSASTAYALGSALLLAACWSLFEISRGWLLTGFPWLAIGYAQVDGPLAGAARLVGVYGLGGLAMLAAAGAGYGGALLRERRHRSAARVILACAAPAALAAIAGATIAPSQGTESLRLRLLQGNVPQQMKFDRARSLQAMRDYTDDALAGSADLTILPETAWTVPWSATPASVAEALRRHLDVDGGLLAIGMPLVRDAPQGRRYTNSVGVIDARGRIVARYDKRHLVPFGEFIPTGAGWFVRMMNIPLGDFGRGARSQPLLAIGRSHVAFNICYEDLFGEELAVQVRDGANLLINVSNIAWFGDSHALTQHLNISRMRAIELGRPIVRATNTGVTAVIGTDGSTLARLPNLQRGVLAIEVAGASGLTPYARWPRTSAALLIASMLVAGLWLTRRAAGCGRKLRGSRVRTG